MSFTFLQSQLMARGRIFFLVETFQNLFLILKLVYTLTLAFISIYSKHPPSSSIIINCISQVILITFTISLGFLSAFTHNFVHVTMYTGCYFVIYSLNLIKNCHQFTQHPLTFIFDTIILALSVAYFKLTSSICKFKFYPNFKNQLVTSNIAA